MQQQRVRRGQNQRALKRVDITNSRTKQIRSQERLVIQTIQLIAIGDDRVGCWRGQQGPQPSGAAAAQHDMAVVGVNVFKALAY